MADEPIDPTQPTDVPPLLAENHPAVADGSVTVSGEWVPPVGPGVPDPSTNSGGRRTLDQWAADYPYDSAPHPYIHEVKAIPMGGDRVPMNHSIDVLNMMAIHLDRRGAVFPDEDGNYPANLPTGRPEIHYQEPEHGPVMVTNPGTWVDIDTPVTSRVNQPLPAISLAGVPADQLQVLQAAIDAEKVRQTMAQGADPAARDAALAQLAAEPTMTVGVVPSDTVLDIKPAEDPAP